MKNFDKQFTQFCFSLKCLELSVLSDQTLKGATTNHRLIMPRTILHGKQFNVNPRNDIAQVRQVCSCATTTKIDRQKHSKFEFQTESNIGTDNVNNVSPAYWQANSRLVHWRQERCCSKAKGHKKRP